MPVPTARVIAPTTVLAMACCLLALAAQAATIEVTPETIRLGLAKLQAGDELVLSDGTYQQFRLEGLQGITIRAANRYRAIIAGAMLDACVAIVNCPGATIDGLQVLGGQYDGMGVKGERVTLRNLWIHHHAGNGIGAHGVTGLTISRCLIEFNGAHLQFSHGVYADGGKLLVEDNIIRHNSGFQLHLYPSIEDSVIRGNLCHDSGLRAAILVQAKEGGKPNLIVSNTVAWSAVGFQMDGGLDRLYLNKIINCGVPFEGKPQTWRNEIVSDKSQAAQRRILWPGMGLDPWGYPYAWRAKWGEPMLPPALWSEENK